MYSFAVTAYNEMSDGGLQGGRILRSIMFAIGDPKIREIVIVDDASEDYRDLKRFLYPHTLVPGTKFKITTNKSNRGVFGNKLEAIAQCSEPWVITCDSDNRMSPDCLNVIRRLSKNANTWLCPSFAKPQFDYRGLVGEYSLENLGDIIDKPMFGCCFNTGNQTVNREEFMKVFGRYRGKRADLLMPNYLGHTCPESIHSRLVFDANDSFIFNMEWLLAGNRLRICEGLEYDHYYTSGPDSNYARAPKEKGVLNDALMKRLRDELGAINA